MPRIASQHAWKDKDHVPSSAWPEDCLVQWGSKGLVFGKDGARTTAFFEAFPQDGFFRGEGETIAAAEEQALLKYRRAVGCPGHQWSRKGYTNRGAFCRLCGKFDTAFRPIVHLGGFRQPVDALEIGSALSGFLLRSGRDDQASLRYHRRVWLRLRVAGFAIPPVPDEQVSILDAEEHPHTQASRNVIMRRIEELGGVEALKLDLSRASLDGVFEAVGFHSLAMDYEDWLAKRHTAEPA